MSNPKAQLAWFGLMAALALVLFPEACIARSRYKDCGFTLCGDVNISFPFRLTSQPSKCGNPESELECEDNNRTTLVTKYGRFHVQNISYEYPYRMRVVDASLGRDACSLPRSSFRLNSEKNRFWASVSFIYLVKCARPINSSLYVDASRCSSQPTYFYFLDQRTSPRDFNKFCKVEAQVPVDLDNITEMSTLDIYRNISMGFHIQWYNDYYDDGDLISLISNE